jgi:hypothetical protein
MGVSPLLVRGGFSPVNFWNSRWQEMHSVYIFEEIDAFNWSQKCRFLGWMFVPLKEKLKKSKLQSKCHKIKTRLTMPWQTLNTPVDVRITFICFSTIHVDSFFRTDLGLKTSWTDLLEDCFFIHYLKLVTSSTFQFRDEAQKKNMCVYGHPTDPINFNTEFG